MATYEYESKSGWDSQNYSWGTAKTQCWVGAYRETNDSSVTVYVHGAVQCDSSYNLDDYGVHVLVGHEGGGGVPAWNTDDSDSPHRGDAVFDGTNTWIPTDYCKSYETFQRKESDYTVRFYCKYRGETVSGYGGCSNSGAAYVDVTIPALPTYTITFANNDGSENYTTLTKTHGINLTIPSSITPTRIGYDFVEWNTEADGSGYSVQPEGEINGDESKTIYAIWTPSTYTVSFDANGGVDAPENQTKIYGEDLVLTSDIPIKDKYNFLGWATSEIKANAGSVEYESGDVYTENAPIELYAVWKLAYAEPTISNFAMTRCDESGNDSASGMYVKVSFDWTTDPELYLASYIVKSSDSNFIYHLGELTEQESSGSTTAIAKDYTFIPYENYEIVVEISDSENIKASVTHVLEKELYLSPTISNISAIRTGEDRVKNDEGECGLITFDWSIDKMRDGSNSVSNITVAYQEHGTGLYPNAVEVEYDNSVDSSSATAFVPNNVLDSGKSYDFVITVEDKISSVVKYTIITYAFCTMDFRAGGKGIAIGKYSDADIFDVDMPTKFRKEVEINGRKYGENQILWSSEDDTEAAKFLGEDSAVAFNHGKNEGEFHKVSEQPNGIVLVFSYFDNEDDTAENATWNCHFIPKSMIGENGLDKAGSHTLTMATFTSTIDIFGIKHLYISDTRIEGYVKNSITETSACGIKYSNNSYVLRYVIGV